MKNKELDMLIVVNMFLTGFDATTLNILWVDKNLKMHGLIQAFSRTNQILNSIKTFGNVVCFRNLQKRVDSAISLFGDKNAGGIVLMQSFKDYYYGHESVDGKQMLGYVDMIEELTNKFPLTEPQIIGEQNQKDFIALFGSILHMRNLLVAFDEFKEKELLSERDLQDYLGRYQDLRDEWKRRRDNGESTDIIDDIVFEVELIKQIEINIDYILMLVKKYHDTHCEDKEVLITIRKAIEASPELRSKKDLIEAFINGINEVDDVMIEWHSDAYFAKEFTKHPPNEKNLLKGKIVCGDCGKGMRLSPRTTKSYVYFCGTFSDGINPACSRHKIDQEDVNKAVFAHISNHMRCCIDALRVIRELNARSSGLKKYDVYGKAITRQRRELEITVNELLSGERVSEESGGKYGEFS